MPRARRKNSDATAATAPAASALTQLLLESLRNDRVHERADVAAEFGDLANQARRNERVMLRRRQEYGLDTVDQMSIHRGELKLIFEVRDGTQAPDDRFEAVGARELDREARVAGHRYLGQVAKDFFRELDALLESEQGRLFRIRSNRDDDLVEQAHAAANEVLMTACDRVERAGIHCADFHDECVSLADCRSIVASSNRRSPYSTPP